MASLTCSSNPPNIIYNTRYQRRVLSGLTCCKIEKQKSGVIKISQSFDKQVITWLNYFRIFYKTCQAISTFFVNEQRRLN